jgi:molybdate transport system regulatory protein
MGPRVKAAPTGAKRRSPAGAATRTAEGNTAGRESAAARPRGPTPAAGRPTGGRSAPQPQLRVMFRTAIAMGPGKAALLEAIDRSGSISAAARELGMSYRRAWLLLDTMNQCFKAPVIDTLTGGSGGGGARITEMGREILNRYRAMVAKASAAVEGDMRDFIALMADSPPPDGRGGG